MVLTEALCRAAYSKNLSVGELLQVKRASGARRKVHDDMTACVVFLDAGAYAGGRRSPPLASRSASHGSLEAECSESAVHTHGSSTAHGEAPKAKRRFIFSLGGGSRSSSSVSGSPSGSPPSDAASPHGSPLGSYPPSASPPGPSSPMPSPPRGHSHESAVRGGRHRGGHHPASPLASPRSPLSPSCAPAGLPASMGEPPALAPAFTPPPPSPCASREPSVHGGASAGVLAGTGGALGHSAAGASHHTASGPAADFGFEGIARAMELLGLAGPALAIGDQHEESQSSSQSCSSQGSSQGTPGGASPIASRSGSSHPNRNISYVGGHFTGTSSQFSPSRRFCGGSHRV